MVEPEIKHPYQHVHQKIAGVDVLTRVEAAAGSETPLGSATVSDRGNIVRFAVARGIPEHDRQFNNDAIDLVVGACRDESSLSLAMPVANRDLRDHLTRQPQAGLVDAAVVDWDPEFGDVHAVQAGEMDVWVLSRGRWEMMFENEPLSTEARQRLATLSTGGAGPMARATVSHMFDDRGDWLSAPVGRFDKCITRTASAFGVQAIVVCTPDLGATPERFADLGRWWAAVHEGPEGVAELHGELIMLFAASLS